MEQGHRASDKVSNVDDDLDTNYDDIDDKLPHLFKQKLENNDTIQIINFSIESFQKEAFMIVSIEFLEQLLSSTRKKD